MKLLHIDSSILGANSVSRQLSAGVVEKLKAADPSVEVTYTDLAANPIPHLSSGFLAAAQSPTGDHEPDVLADLAGSGQAMQDFKAADVIVIGLGFYNFTIPSQLKAWIDRILVAGQTFRYNADGRPEGLCGDKRVILAIARGGFYGPGSPTQSAEMAESYLRLALGFIGITKVDVVAAEGIAVGPDHRAAGIASAQEQIAALAI